MHDRDFSSSSYPFTFWDWVRRGGGGGGGGGEGLYFVLLNVSILNLTAKTLVAPT